MENEIREAVTKFESLLRQQLERQERMEQAAPEKDFGGMKTITVGLIDGDGIGPIIMKQAERVLEKLLSATRIPSSATWIPDCSLAVRSRPP